MHIKIVGFKYHIDASYDFNSNSITLLKGKSGKGKSTILKAIYWCLYGSMRGVYNNTGKIKKCSVTLKINDLVIYRQKRPELLKITINNQEYEDIVAQQIIDQSFGPNKLWKACSYIVQKKRCSLLSGSASEKLDLLNQLSFDKDDPKEYISRIDAELKTVNTKFITIQAEYTAELNIFTNQINKKPVKITMSQIELGELVGNINKNEERAKKLYEDILTQERLQGSYNTVLEQIKTIETKLLTITITNNIDTTTISNEINNLKTQLSTIAIQKSQIDQYNYIKSQIDNNVNKLNTINTELNLIPDNLPSLNPTNEQIWQVSNQENQRLHYIQECKNLNIEYNKDKIANIILVLKTSIKKSQNIQNNIGTYNRLKSLKSSIVNYDQTLLNNEYVKKLEKQIQEISAEISELKRGLELLECPECSKSLRYVGNKLIKGERSPVSQEEITKTESTHNNLINKLQNIRNGININNQINTLSQHLSGIDINELENPSTNLYQEETKLSKLSKIIYINQPTIPSNILKSVNKKNLLIVEKTNIEQTLKNLILPDVPNIKLLDSNAIQTAINMKQSYLHGINTNNTTNNINRITKNELENTLSNLKLQQQNIEASLKQNTKELYNSVMIGINEKNKKYADGIYGNEMISKQQILTKKRTEVININNDLMSIQRLKQKAIDVEHKQLQDTVTNINMIMENILPLFFDEPISVRLQLYKFIKTNKTLKPCLNISIKHEGAEYNDIDDVSGGQGDRISLALVLALNQVSNSPIILLDECISSLDGTCKESCVESMKKIENKTIICVDHEGVEGFYDQVIYLC